MQNFCLNSQDCEEVVKRSLSTVYSNQPTILEILQKLPEKFSTILSLIEKAGLTNVLKDEGPLTLLAPENSVFEGVELSEITPRELKILLQNHLLNGNLNKELLHALNGKVIKSVGKGSYTISAPANSVYLTFFVHRDGKMIEKKIKIKEPYPASNGSILPLNGVIG